MFASLIGVSPWLPGADVAGLLLELPYRVRDAVEVGEVKHDRSEAGDIEGDFPVRVDDVYHGLLDGVSHGQFVEHVCVVFGEVGDDEV